jgi:hypothetical protein
MIRRGSSRLCGAFPVILCGDFRSSLLWFSWRSFKDDFLGILLGVTYEDLMPLWLVTLPPNLPWIGLDLVVFWVDRVHALVRRNLRFLLILCVSGWFLWGRGFPGGNPAIPEVSLQSMEWFGRLGDGKLRVDSRVGFPEGAVYSLRGDGLTVLGVPGRGFDFAGFPSVSLFALIRGAFRWNLGSFSCCLLGVLAWSLLLGTGG